MPPGPAVEGVDRSGPPRDSVSTAPIIACAIVCPPSFLSHAFQIGAGRSNQPSQSKFTATVRARPAIRADADMRARASVPPVSKYCGPLASEAMFGCAIRCVASAGPVEASCAICKACGYICFVSMPLIVLNVVRCESVDVGGRESRALLTPRGSPA
eukprot:3972863-Lingulodinium_polyedra.AAC.1